MGKTVNRTDPYERITVQGKRTDRRSQSALVWAEKRYVRRGVGRKPWGITQAGYNAGGVSASAGTHDGGGVYDLSVAGLNPKQIKAMVKWLRKAGFAAWFRDWPGNQHVHAVLLGHRTASPGAKQQMESYRAGRDGLAANLLDSTWRPKPLPRWSHRQNRPIKHPKRA